MIEFFLAGAGTVWFSQVIWAFVQRSRKPKPPKPIEAKCGCSHHFSTHDAKTGECHDWVRFKVTDGEPILDSYKSYVVTRTGAKFETRQCGCRRYTGPEPLPSYYAPEISP